MMTSVRKSLALSSFCMMWTRVEAMSSLSLTLTRFSITSHRVKKSVVKYWKQKTSISHNLLNSVKKSLTDVSLHVSCNLHVIYNYIDTALSYSVCRSVYMLWYNVKVQDDKRTCVKSWYKSLGSIWTVWYLNLHLTKGSSPLLSFPVFPTVPELAVNHFSTNCRPFISPTGIFIYPEIQQSMFIQQYLDDKSNLYCWNSN